MQTICVSVRERLRAGEAMLSVHNKTHFFGKNMGNFILLFTVLMCLASVVVGFGYVSVIRHLK